MCQRADAYCRPDDVTNVILRGLERQPDDRFQSMDDVIDPWPGEHLRYENGPKHGYLVATHATRDTRGPFCLYLEDFRRRQEYLERLLHEEAKRRTPS